MQLVAIREARLCRKVSQGEEVDERAGGARCVEIVALDCWKLISRRIDWRQHLNCGEFASAKGPWNGWSYVRFIAAAISPARPAARDGDSSALYLGL
jgi:hypothetical protein